MGKQSESLRVALFLDGKGFYLGWKDNAPHCDIDFSRLAKWLMRRVGGGFLTGAYCYVQEFSDHHLAQFEKDLADFFALLKSEDGFFVHGFSQEIECLKCVKCSANYPFEGYKKMDMIIASNVLQLAITDSYDVVVLISDDPDYIPVLETLQFMGKQAYVASWSNGAISPGVRSAAFSCINLSRGLDAFEKRSSEKDSFHLLSQEQSAVAITHFTGEYELDAFMSELAQAEQRFENDDGYVGLGYFLNYWRSEHLDKTPAGRRTVLDRLLVENWVETYDSGGGKLAIQLSDRARERFQEIAAQQ